MHMKDNYKILSCLLIFISFSSFFLGFYLDENSAGAGSHLGDWIFAWPNIQLFISQNVYDSIHSENYLSNRPPLLYILHKLFNPFIETEMGYRRSVFIVSLTTPFLFYFCLKQKFKEIDSLLLFLISSVVLLSPYYRTSAYWGLEENYGYISLLLSFLFLNYFLENNSKKNYKIYFQLFFSIFFSSLCVYFDQKLIVIPLICFFTILGAKKEINFKVLSILFYLIFSLPFIYLVILWGNITPGPVKLTNQLYLNNFGYASTILAFYLIPLFFFKEKKIFQLIKESFLSKINYFLIFLFIIYCIYIFYYIGLSEFYSESNYPSTGKGVIHKISLIVFNDDIIRKIFIYFSFFISWIIIIIFINKNFKDGLILLYFITIFIFINPIFQEYFDPLILLIAFTFLSSTTHINLKNVIVLFLYSSFFLICCNIYYYNLLQ